MVLLATNFTDSDAAFQAIPVQKLTGMVEKIDPYSFAYGGNSDMFKAKYLGREVSMISTPSVC